MGWGEKMVLLLAYIRQSPSSVLLLSTLFFIYGSEGKLSRSKEPHFD
jgi:hypothetical protein